MDSAPGVPANGRQEYLLVDYFPPASPGMAPLCLYEQLPCSNWQ